MFGRSLYLSSSNEEIEFVLNKLQKGEWCFTSLHTPEDIERDMACKTHDLINAIHNVGAKIIADISPRGVKALGYKNLKELALSGIVDAIRCDYGYSTEEMLEAHKHCSIVLNASCADKQEIKRFASTGIPVMAMHNFYPRPETALDEEECLKRNEFMQANNVQSLAFISGLKNPRGPIFEGLPTVEAYRKLPAFVQYSLLRFKLKTDLIFLGDLQMDEKDEIYINCAEKENIISLPIQMKDGFPLEFLNKAFTIRTDSNSYLARIAESREYSALGTSTPPYCNNLPRNAGCITVDNDAYGRYSGEIMIVCKNLAADKRVNVIGELKEEYRSLLQLCTGGTKVRFVLD